MEKKKESYNPDSFSHPDEYYKPGNAEGDEYIHVPELYTDRYSSIGNSHDYDYGKTGDMHTVKLIDGINFFTIKVNSLPTYTVSETSPVQGDWLDLAFEEDTLGFGIGDVDFNNIFLKYEDGQLFQLIHGKIDSTNKKISFKYATLV